MLSAMRDLKLYRTQSLPTCNTQLCHFLLLCLWLLFILSPVKPCPLLSDMDIFCSPFKLCHKCQLLHKAFPDHPEQRVSHLKYVSLVLCCCTWRCWCWALVPAPCIGGQKRSLFIFDYLKYPDLCLAHFSWLMSFYWSRMISTHLKLRK